MKAKLWQIKPAIAAKITAKRIIKILASFVLCLWLIAYLYLMSNKGFGPVFNYDNAFLDKKSLLQDQLAKKKLASDAELKSVYVQLTEIALCENNFVEAQSSVEKLDKLSVGEETSLSGANLDFFIANVYRDFDKLAQAQKRYALSLSKLSSQAGEHPISKAKVLNNIGTAYFLQAQSTLDKNESQREYLLSSQCFIKARDLAGVGDLNLKTTIQNNLNQCSSELKFLN